MKMQKLAWHKPYIKPLAEAYHSATFGLHIPTTTNCLTGLLDELVDCQEAQRFIMLLWCSLANSSCVLRARQTVGAAAPRTHTVSSALEEEGGGGWRLEGGRRELSIAKKHRFIMNGRHHRVL